MSDLEELRQLVRASLDDNTSSNLGWEDTEIDGFLNEGENEACLRAGLLVDETSAFTSISVVADTASYSLDTRIIKVQRAKLDLDTIPLSKKTRYMLDTTINNWEADTGTPICYLTDIRDTLKLYPNPIVNDTLTLRVSRLPLVKMVANEDTPEIDDQYHPGLVLWALHKAYLKQDQETLDLIKARSFNKKFVDYFGKRRSAKADQFQSDDHFVASAY